MKSEPLLAGIEPSAQAAWDLLARFSPQAYAATRNRLDGAVSKLSAHLTHGFLSLAEVFGAIDARHPLDIRDKFVFELGWRAYYRHVWHFLGDEIHQSLHPGPLPDSAYSRHMPLDVLEGRSGIPAIDLAVRELYTTGYLHNHARMWLASYLVHLRKVHWHCAAQWMLGHLLDGDVASNHLSWQWVAGTGSVKPYLFNAENVAKFAPPPWHSENTAIDVSYETLCLIARQSTQLVSESLTCQVEDLLREPPVSSSPNDGPWQEPDAHRVRQRNVWLVHPWSLAGAPSSMPGETLCIGVGFTECHAAHPWSAQRWDFVTRGMQGQVDQLWWGDTARIAHALHEAHSVQWRCEPHADKALARLSDLLNAHGVPPSHRAQEQTPLFEPVERYCPSFSQWWRLTRLRV